MIDVVGFLMLGLALWFALLSVISFVKFLVKLIKERRDRKKTRADNLEKEDK